MVSKLMRCFFTNFELGESEGYFRKFSFWPYEKEFWEKKVIVYVIGEIRSYCTYIHMGATWSALPKAPTYRASRSEGHNP